MVDQSNASIVAFPFELLEEITLIAIGYYVDLSFLNPNNLDTHDGPRKYSQICSWWRSIVLASPKAWSDIIITKPYSIHDLNRVKNHFELSKDAILRVYIEMDNDSAPLEMVFTHLKTRRLRELGLHIPQGMFRFLQELQPHSLVTIRRLRLLQTLEPGQFCIQSTSSSLPDMTFRDIPVFSSILLSASLTSLSISLPKHIEGEDLSFLCHLRDLITLSIYQHADCVHIYPSRADYSVSVNIELPHLKELKVHHANFFAIQNISCPALETLDIDDPHPEHVYTFIDEGLICSLVNLTLRSCDISHQSVNIFRLLPSLASLRIFVAEDAVQKVLALLSRLSMVSSPSGLPCLLPKLQVLDISMSSHWIWDENILCQLLNARWTLPSVSLKTIVFKWNCPPRPESLSEYVLLRGLPDRGRHHLDMSYIDPADGNGYRRMLFLY